MCPCLEAELTAALEECATTVHDGVVTCEKKSDNLNLGPTITVSARVNEVLASKNKLDNLDSTITVLARVNGVPTV